mmetsp:Transcript_441/g.832  ORF Transcript_441/g.832 Transcript_441/m.832 type:complete len:319 (-) Transcript_441:264-1220(-)
MSQNLATAVWTTAIAFLSFLFSTLRLLFSTRAESSWRRSFLLRAFSSPSSDRMFANRFFKPRHSRRSCCCTVIMELDLSCLLAFCDLAISFVERPLAPSLPPILGHRASDLLCSSRPLVGFLLLSLLRTSCNRSSSLSLLSAAGPGSSSSMQMKFLSLVLGAVVKMRCGACCRFAGSAVVVGRCRLEPTSDLEAFGITFEYRIVRVSGFSVSRHGRSNVSDAMRSGAIAIKTLTASCIVPLCIGNSGGMINANFLPLLTEYLKIASTCTMDTIPIETNSRVDLRRDTSCSPDHVKLPSMILSASSSVITGFGFLSVCL